MLLCTNQSSYDCPTHTPASPTRLQYDCITFAQYSTPTRPPFCMSLSKPGGGNVTDRESNPRPLGRMTGDSTTRLKRSAVMSGTGIHRLIYRDICVERGASYAACAAHNSHTPCFCAQINHHTITPHTHACIAHTIAIRLHYYCTARSLP